MSIESQGIINLQSGTNQFASQKGMSFGAVRHISDIGVDAISREGHGIINLQAGTNQFASQRGMNIGGSRHISDIRADRPCLESEAVIRLQAGTNQYANQQGISFGKPRGINDIKVVSKKRDDNAHDQFRRYYDYDYIPTNSYGPQYQDDDDGWL